MTKRRCNRCRVHRSAGSARSLSARGRAPIDPTWPVHDSFSHSNDDSMKPGMIGLPIHPRVACSDLLAQRRDLRHAASIEPQIAGRKQRRSRSRHTVLCIWPEKPRPAIELRSRRPDRPLRAQRTPPPRPRFRDLARPSPAAACPARSRERLSQYLTGAIDQHTLETRSPDVDAEQTAISGTHPFRDPALRHAALSDEYTPISSSRLANKRCSPVAITRMVCGDSTCS